MKRNHSVLFLRDAKEHGGHDSVLGLSDAKLRQFIVFQMC